MNLLEMSLVLLGGLIFLLLIGTEIFVAITIMAAVGLSFFVGQPMRQFAVTAFDVMNSFVLTCMPLFIFMGAIFSTTGITERLFYAADKIIGNLPGGIASSVLGACAIFGAMSGSSLAAAATFGKIALPEMEKLGYDPKLSLGTIAIGGTLSVLIPPSVILIVYGGWQNVSVARLFAAALLPGIVLTSLLVFTVILMVLIKPELAPKSKTVSWKERGKSISAILPFLGVIIVVLGVIFGGVMTPTEAAAVGAVLSIVLALAYRRMSLSAFKESMLTAIKLNAMIAFIIFTARVLAQVFNYIGLTDAFSVFITGLGLDKYGVFIIICLMYLILGMFFDALSMLVLTIPFVGPLMVQLGFHPVWFGVTYVILVEIGLVTPPFGLNLFVLRGVVPQYDILLIARGALPFLIPAVLMIIIMVLFPQLALWLPSVLY